MELNLEINELVQSKLNKFTKYIQDFFPEYIKEKLTLENLFFRGLLFILSSFMLSVYIYVPFLLYMQEYKFYSYDFFTSEGLFAINVFLVIIVFLIIGMSFLLVFGIIRFISDFLIKNIRKVELKYDIFPLVINIIIGIILIFFFNSKEYQDTTTNNVKEVIFSTIIFTYLLSFFLSTHIIISTSFYIKTRYIFLTTVLLYTLILPVLFLSYQKQVVDLVSISLKNFGVGGEVKIEVYDKRFDNINNKGKLIFLSPKNIYVQYDNDKFLTIEDRNNKFIKSKLPENNTTLK
jgi:hypothetical protein